MSSAEGVMICRLRIVLLERFVRAVCPGQSGSRAPELARGPRSKKIIVPTELARPRRSV